MKSLHVLLLCAFPGVFARVLPGQATGTAHQGVRLYAYGMASYVRPDFGGALKNAGATLGGTANVFTHSPLELGLDVRATGSGGRVSKQYFFGGGPRAQVDLGWLQPFAQFHIGYGNLVFQNVVVPGYTHDDAIVKAYGGGADVKVSRFWAVRGEVERQSWQFHADTTTFHPLVVSAGLRYQFHFHNRYGPE